MNKKTIGNNIVLTLWKKKYVIGLKRNIHTILIMSAYFLIAYLYFILTTLHFYTYISFSFLSLLFILMFINYWLCFLKEPGIIPRSSDMFKIENDFLNNNSNSSSNTTSISKPTHPRFHKESNDIILNKDFKTVRTEEMKHNNKTSNRGIYNTINSHPKRKVIDIFPEFNDVNEDDITQQNTVDNDNQNKKDELNNTLIFIKNDILTTAAVPSNIENSHKHNNNVEVNADNINNNISNNNSSNLTNENNSSYAVIPLIFQKKICITCGITRPSKASHCKICDNCIFNLDHHCFYVSNCIGERNHVNFIMFLLSGCIITVISFLMVLYHVVFVLFIYKYRITMNIIKNNSFVFSMSMFCFGIALILGIVLHDKKKMFVYIPYISGNVLFGFLFINEKSKLSDVSKSDKYFHIYSSLYLPIVFPACYIVLSNFIKQMNVIGKGLTIKQYNSISKQRDQLKKEGKDCYTMNMYLNKRISFGNIYMFFKRKHKKSLVNHKV